MKPLPKKYISAALGILLLGVLGAATTWSLQPSLQADRFPASTEPSKPALLDLIPDGIIAGRQEAKYGTYNTPMKSPAQRYQRRLTELERKAYGLSQTAEQNPVEQAEKAYAVEFETVALLREIANAPKGALSEFEKNSLQYASIRVYEDVRHHSERLYENMIRYIDQKFPGPNGQQIRRERARSTEAVYTPNYRSDEDLTPRERAALYQQKLQEFTAKGGSLDEIRTLTPESYKDLPEYSRFEYVVLESGELKVTEGNAGHILLAGGKRVRAAGQLVFIKNRLGKMEMVIVSNASGSYKPDILSARQLADRLESETGAPGERVVVTKGEPLSTQTIKIFLKGMGTDPAESKKKLKSLEELGKETISRPPMLIRCAQAFSS